MDTLITLAAEGSHFNDFISTALAASVGCLGALIVWAVIGEPIKNAITKK